MDRGTATTPNHHRRTPSSSPSPRRRHLLPVPHRATPDPGEDVAVGALARDGGGEVGALIKQHAALAVGSRQRRRDLLRRDADAVRHDRLQRPHAQRRLHGHHAQVHALLPLVSATTRRPGRPDTAEH